MQLYYIYILFKEDYSCRIEYFAYYTLALANGLGILEIMIFQIFRVNFFKTVHIW